MTEGTRDRFNKWIKDNDLWSAMNHDGPGCEQWAWEAWQARGAGQAELRKASAALVSKLKLIIPKIDSMCVMEAIHGRPYKGPNLAEELAMLEAVLGENL